MPLNATLLSGTRVDVLCGQPEQKYGVRTSPLLRIRRHCGGFHERLAGRRATAQFVNVAAQGFVGHSAGEQALADRQRNLCRRKSAIRRQQRLTLGRALARKPWSPGKTVQRGVYLALNKRTLFLDYQQLLEPTCKGAQALAVERPDEPELPRIDAQRVGALAVYAEEAQGIQHICEGLAGADDAEARTLSRIHRTIHPVRTREGVHERQAIASRE